MKKSKTNIFIIIGLLLLAAALVLTGKNILEEQRGEKLSIGAAEKLISQIEPQNSASTTNREPGNSPEYTINPDIEMPTKRIDGLDYIGVLRVPALGLKLPVLSEWSYDNLTVSPCRYTGSAYLGNMVIAAHNYRSHFARLRSLQPGDKVRFTDVDSNRFDYEVVETEILLPEQVEKLNSGNWDLTLFTCTFGGEYRITVRCKAIER